MIKNEIEKIKKGGTREALLNAITGKLWYAKLAIEDAGKDQFKDFTKQIIKVKTLISDAEQLFEEVNKK